MTDEANDNKKISRRKLLVGAATAASITMLKTVWGQTIPVQTGVPISPVVPVIPVDPTKQPGSGPGTVGNRSVFEHPVKKPTEFASRAPLQDQIGMLTPSDLHFERHHAGVPVIDPAKYELLIHGMVDKPMVFTLNDLKRFPALQGYPARLLLPGWEGNRAVDETGYTQPTLGQLIAARGADMGGYHLNPVTSWRIRRDGAVLFKPEKFK
jgi:hypothetical protein